MNPAPKIIIFWDNIIHLAGFCFWNTPIWMTQDLPWHEAIKHYIATHTANDILKQERNKKTKRVTLVHDPYGTSRNSTAAVSAWRKSLGFLSVSQIQTACQDPMQELGYKLVTSQVGMESQDLGLEKAADQVWPY